MSDPTPSRRFALLLAITFGILISNCTRYYIKPGKETFCDTGNGSPSRPLICVDERTMMTSPAVTYVFDVESVGGTPKNRPVGKPTNRPVVIQWVSRRGANLGVEFTDKSCVEQVTCSGNGHCSAKVKKLREGEKSRRCNYSLNLDGRESDPPIVVNPCCWVSPEILHQLGGSTPID